MSVNIVQIYQFPPFLPLKNLTPTLKEMILRLMVKAPLEKR